MKHPHTQTYPCRLQIEHDEQVGTSFIVRRTSSHLRSNVQTQQDEDALLRYHIPLSMQDITHSSTEEYNQHLARLNHLTSEQIHIIKDIRRRGKNKVSDYS
jgi:hypothetical protein